MGMQGYTDIRGEGFPARTRVGRTLALWLRSCLPLPGEVVALAQADGRCPVSALDVVPAMGRVARARQNGIALRAEQTFGASVYDPVILPETDIHPFSTGEPLPRGYDAVVPYNALRHFGGGIQVLGPVAPGEGVLADDGVAAVGRTSDSTLGGAPDQGRGVTIPGGRMLTPALIALLAGSGVATVTVHGRPRVRLVAVGSARSGPADQVTAALTAAIMRAGGTVVGLLRPAATLEAVGAALLPDDTVDLVVAVGRTGTGPDDIAPPALALVGEVMVHGLALRPGGSAAVGFAPADFTTADLGGGAAGGGMKPVLLLPGQPPSALTAFGMLGVPVLARLAGQVPLPAPQVVRTTLLGRKLVSEPGMLDVIPMRIDHDGIAFPLGDPSQLGLATLIADGVAIVAEDSEGQPAGSEVVIYSLTGSLSGGDDEG